MRRDHRGYRQLAEGQDRAVRLGQLSDLRKYPGSSPVKPGIPVLRGPCWLILNSIMELERITKLSTAGSKVADVTCFG